MVNSCSTTNVFVLIFAILFFLGCKPPEPYKGTVVHSPRWAKNIPYGVSLFHCFQDLAGLGGSAEFRCFEYENDEALQRLLELDELVYLGFEFNDSIAWGPIKRCEVPKSTIPKCVFERPKEIGSSVDWSYLEEEETLNFMQILGGSRDIDVVMVDEKMQRVYCCRWFDLPYGEQILLEKKTSR